MLLAIDVGNTETVVGLFADDLSAPLAATGPRDGNEPTGLAHHWRLSTVAERTSDEHALLLTQLLDLDGLDIDDAVSGIAVTSSVPLVTANLRQMVARWFDVPSVVLEPGVRSGMPILYDNPKEVGADRIANAVGAYDLFGGPCVVVDLGTATTFDAISAAGEYLGGAITPGVAISLDALFANAAALGRVELVAAEERDRQIDGGVDPVRCPLRLRRPGRRPVPKVRGRPGRMHRGGHRGAVRAHLPVFGGDRVRGAVAHPPRPSDHLRAQFTQTLPAVGESAAPGLLRRFFIGPGTDPAMTEGRWRIAVFGR